MFRFSTSSSNSTSSEHLEKSSAFNDSDSGTFKIWQNSSIRSREGITEGNVVSRTKYGNNRKPEYREDYGHTHHDKNTGKDLQPHKHNYEYNDKGQPVKPKVPVEPIPLGRKKIMSIGVSGIIYLNNKEVSYKNKLSFKVVEYASQYRIGCKLGGNVSNKVIDNYETLFGENILAFELMDTPIDNTADVLFGNELYDDSSDNSLILRLKRVEGFLEDVLSDREISKLLLDINYYETPVEYNLKIKNSNFTKEIVRLYEKDSVFAPVVKVIIDN